MGESEEDRIGLLEQLSSLEPHPESVPINMLMRAEGTPLANAADLDPLDHGADYRYRAHPDARFHGPDRCWTQAHVSRGGNTVFPGRRQLNFHRRPLAHDSKSWSR